MTENTEEPKTEAVCTDPQWLSTDDGEHYVMRNQKLSRELPPGVYEPEECEFRGAYLCDTEIVCDDLLDIGNPVVGDLVDHFVEFLTKRDKFEEMGFVYKRGFLLYGPPGSGKTSTLHELSSKIVELGGYVLLGTCSSPRDVINGIKLLRRVHQDAPVMVILEDFDTIISARGAGSWLSILDGEDTIDNVMYVATTNYIERFPDNLIKRPSRFDKLVYVGMPPVEVRRAYFDLKAPQVDEVTRQRWADRTQGLSVAHLKEVLLSQLVFEEDEDLLFDRLKGEMVREDPEQKKLAGDGGSADKTSTPPTTDQLVANIHSLYPGIDPEQVDVVLSFLANQSQAA